ncbi:MAG: hypothetical protein WHT07_12175 [Desulfobaccales bacterium]
MVAVPVLRSRVAPVLDWCSRYLIFPAAPSAGEVSQELALPHLEAGQRLQRLRERGVRVLICGALSSGLLCRARELGLAVVCGVAGEVQDVIHSYWQNTLDQPRFRLPGCKGARRSRRGWRGGRRGFDAAQIKVGGGFGRNQPLPATAPGSEGWCRCPDCGVMLSPKPGVPCLPGRCPHCGHSLTPLREG